MCTPEQYYISLLKYGGNWAPSREHQAIRCFNYVAILGRRKNDGVMGAWWDLRYPGSE